MAANDTQNPLHIHTLPQPNYIDAVRWIPPPSPFHRLISAATFDCDTSTSTIQILSLTLPQTQPNHNHNHHPPPPTLTLQSSHPTPSRITSLKVSHHHTKPLVAASTSAGSLHLLVTDPASGRVERELSLPAGELHVGPISCVDVAESGSECVTVGEDGRVCLVSVGGGSGGLGCRRVFDGNGLVGYTAAKWASPTEFATGGLGFGLQWWDLRKPGGPASQLKGNWARATTSGIVHSIDIHPSRKYTCVAGGSAGTVFAWDLRWQQQPIILSGVGIGDVPAYSPCESEVWEVQYDSYMHSKNIGNMSSSRILPVMICSEDGILAVVEQGEDPIELLAEPCAINSFDINRQHPSDVICSLEWESIAILLRS